MLAGFPDFPEIFYLGGQNPPPLWGSAAKRRKTEGNSQKLTVFVTVLGMNFDVFSRKKKQPASWDWAKRVQRFIGEHINLLVAEVDLSVLMEWPKGQVEEVAI